MKEVIHHRCPGDGRGCNKTLGELKVGLQAEKRVGKHRCNKTLGELKALDLEFYERWLEGCNKTLGELKEGGEPAEKLAYVMLQ